MHGNIGPNYNTNRADVILAVGMRFDDRVTGKLEAYAPDAKIIHVDIDSSEFNKNVKAALTVHADAKQALEALLPKINKTRRDEWLASFKPCEEVEREKVINPEVYPGSGMMKMGEVVNLVSRAFGDRAIGVTDVGQNQMFGSRYFRFTEPRSLLTSGGLGTMGFGLPAAIGAKMGCPDRQVVLFVGDGGFQMTIQENRHDIGVWHAREDGAPEQQFPRQCAPVAAIVLQRPFLADPHGQPRLCGYLRGLRHSGGECQRPLAAFGRDRAYGQQCRRVSAQREHRPRRHDIPDDTARRGCG